MLCGGQGKTLGSNAFGKHSVLSLPWRHAVPSSKVNKGSEKSCSPKPVSLSSTPHSPTYLIRAHCWHRTLAGVRQDISKPWRRPIGQASPLLDSSCPQETPPGTVGPRPSTVFCSPEALPLYHAGAPAHGRCESSKGVKASQQFCIVPQGERLWAPVLKGPQVLTVF